MPLVLISQNGNDLASKKKLKNELAAFRREIISRNIDTVDNLNKINDSNSPSTVKLRSTLILTLISKAVAGNGGTAISAPVSRAIIKSGTRTTIIFHPQSVAVAGVGGIAHAHSDLILDYV